MATQLELARVESHGRCYTNVCCRPRSSACCFACCIGSARACEIGRRGEEERMKYLILRKRPGAPDNPFVRLVAAGGGDADFQFPFQVESHDLPDNEANDLRCDPNVGAVILSMPFTLVKPVAEAGG